MTTLKNNVSIFLIAAVMFAGTFICCDTVSAAISEGYKLDESNPDINVSLEYVCTKGQENSSRDFCFRIAGIHNLEGEATLCDKGVAYGTFSEGDIRVIPLAERVTIDPETAYIITSEGKKYTLRQYQDFTNGVIKVPDGVDYTVAEGAVYELLSAETSATKENENSYLKR